MSVTCYLSGRFGNIFFALANMIAYSKKHDLDYYVPTEALAYNHFRDGDIRSPLMIQSTGNKPINPVEYNEPYDNGHPYYHEIPKMDNVLLEGYYQSFRYVDWCREHILETFNFPYQMDEGVVSISVRRGDCIGVDAFPIAPPVYYHKAVEYMQERGYHKFLVHSDDQPWCMQEFTSENYHGAQFEFSSGSEMEDFLGISQCQPVGTKVTLSDLSETNIEQLKQGDRVCSYSYITTNLSDKGLIRKTRHTNGRRIISITDREYDGDLIVIKSGGKVSKYTPDHHCIVKMGDALKGKYIIYLMKKGNKYRVGVTKPSRNIRGRKCDGVIGFADPRSRMNCEQADSIWVLTMFDDEQSALIEEEFVSCTFGIPQVRFREGNKNQRGLVKQKLIDRFWERFGDNDIKGVISCLRYYKRDIRYPFYDSNRKKIVEAKNGTIFRSCNLLSGMTVMHMDKYLSESNGKGHCVKAWVPINISHEKYNGIVYSMTVDKNHTYVGDGIITHNCEHNITARSTFSLSAAWMNRNPHKIVLVPQEKKWWKGQNLDLIPDYFTQIYFDDPHNTLT